MHSDSCCQDKNQNKPFPLLVVNLFWVVGVLIGLLILAATLRIREKSAVDFINFAATLVSLVVGVVAIVYAFISSTPLNDATARAADAAATVKAETERIRAIVGELATTGQRLTNEVTAFSAKAEDLQSSVRGLGETTGSIHRNVERMVNGESISRPTPASGAGVKADDEPASLYRQQHLSSYIASVSFAGLGILYAAGHAAKLGQSLLIPQFTRLCADVSPDYLVGYLFSAAAGGLFEKFELGDGGQNPVFISSIEMSDADFLIELCERRADKMFSIATTNSEMISGMINGVRRHFGQQERSFGRKAP